MQHAVFATPADHDPVAEIRLHVLHATMAAAQRGVPLVVTIHGAEQAEELIAEPIDVTIDDDAVLTISTMGKRRVVHLVGPEAPAILPTIVACDASRTRMVAASRALSRLSDRATEIDVDDGENATRMTPDMVMITSTGIYPAGVLGVEWDDDAVVEAAEEILRISTPGRVLTLRAA